MDPMQEGVRIHPQRDGTFVAEVVMNYIPVWTQPNFRTYQTAKDEADRQLAHLKQRR
jgi:hypothetical protein